MLNRREFFAGAACLGAAACGGCATTPQTSSRGTFAEPARQLPVDDWADVIVAGGGPAGVAAAVNAARTGRKVRLFELQGCLGGVWTAGLLTYIFDFDKSETDRDASGRRIETIVTESKSGRQDWRARAFVDCTGDGDLAALAGCGYDLGYTPDGFGQPATRGAYTAATR